jgi:uncharacterized membrane protein YfcA
MDAVTLHVLVVLFAATLIRSAFGFGEALVAVPLLCLRIPVAVAAPLAVAVSVLVAGVIVAQDWRHIHVGSAAKLVLASAAGIPLGLLVLATVNDRIVRGGLGVVIVLFAVYCLVMRDRLVLKKDHGGLLLACGFCAGVLGGAYGMNGPPLAIYGALRRWSPQHFRATLQAYFLPASALGLAGFAITGLWGREATRYFLLSLPLNVAAILVGRAINRRLRGERFVTYLYAGLVVIGVVLLGQVSGWW